MGSGTILTDGGQGTFTMNVMKVKGGKVKGNFSYSDSAVQLSFSATKFSSLTFSGRTAQFSGTGKVGKKQKFNFTVYATDNGDPGTNDTFSINLSNGYSAGGNLTSGNIAIH